MTEPMMIIAYANDHSGYPMREDVLKILLSGSGQAGVPLGA
jgi:hypothetical protein